MTIAGTLHLHTCINAQAQNSKEQKAHSFDFFDAAASRRNAHVPTAAIFPARSSQPE